MPVLVAHDPAQDEHDPGPGHPERPSRAAAALRGILRSPAADDLVRFVPRPATPEELAAVHDPQYVRSLHERCAVGGGSLDADTLVDEGSYDLALRAAGAGLDAVARLDAGEADAAFLVLRPPGHHARRDRAMGFCLFNNLAVTAAALLRRGERVLVLDWDAHHGNGTQESFVSEPDLLFVSLHQYPWYPGTGGLGEVGTGAGAGATINVPLPAGTRGDAYRQAVEEVVLPAAEVFAPSWLLVSAGFDAHRDDPLAQLELSAGDFADLTERVARLVAPGRRILFLEGGYDLEALAACTEAVAAALAGERIRAEPVTTSPDHGAAARDGVVGQVVTAARLLHERAIGM
ncbi:MAG TPA: histone deacetylase [Acidimicrobiales bacterium]|nr:histone deacetylase [Acidimicrobiales bacterium]